MVTDWLCCLWPLQQREAELLQTARSSAVAVGRADTAPRTLPLPGVLQVQDAVVDDIVGAAIVEVMNVLTMEPGEEQTSMLRELMTKYAPPAAEDVDADEAATKIQSVFRGHQARQSIDSEEKRQAQAEQEVRLPDVDVTMHISPPPIALDPLKVTALLADGGAYSLLGGSGGCCS